MSDSEQISPSSDPISNDDISADSVVRAPRWLGPLKRWHPRYQLNRGLGYYFEGVKNIRYVLVAHDDWREKAEMRDLVDEGIR